MNYNVNNMLSMCREIQYSQNPLVPLAQELTGWELANHISIYHMRIQLDKSIVANYNVSS